MYDLEYKFEEVPLCIGETLDSRLNIALINGIASITVHGKGDWEIEEVWLDSPLINERRIKIDPTQTLWGQVTESIEHSCGDSIWDKTIEFCAESHDDRTYMERMA